MKLTVRAIGSLLVGALALGVLDGRDAEACTCIPEQSIPGSTDADVPTNLDRILVMKSFAGPELWREATGERVPLRAAQEVSTLRTYDWLQYELGAELLPNETYVIGTLSSELGRFTTGDGPDVVAPTATLHGIDIARATLVDVVSSCGNELTALDDDITASEDAVVAQVRVTGPNMDVYAELRLPFGLGFLSSEVCALQVLYTPGEEYCFEVRPRDWAGNVGEPTTACTIVRSCGDVTDSYDWRDDAFTCPQRASASGCSAPSRPGALAPIVVTLAFVWWRRRRRVTSRAATHDASD